MQNENVAKTRTITEASESDQKTWEEKEKRRSFLPAPKSYVKPQVVKDPLLTETELTGGSSDLCIGNRVCIGGVKFGTLLYYGTTHITGGLWCGIELDDPEGKHDGQVEGVQYFHCKLGHGIFAPAERVALVEKHGWKSGAKPLNKRKIQEPQTYKLLQTRSEETEFSSNEDVSTTGKESAVGNTVAQPNTKLPRKTVHFSKKEKIAPCEVRISESKLIERHIGFEEVNGSDTDEEVKSKKVKPSRLPGFSRLPQAKKTDTQIQSNIEKDVKADIEGDETNVNKTCLVEEKKPVVNETFEIPDKTFTFPDHQGLTDSGSSNDDSLSLDAKQCLASDGRQYLNLTFDTESTTRGFSPPNISVALDKLNNSGSQQDLDVSEASSKSAHHSHDSSLGLLNPDLVKEQSELVDEVNLTDSEKILKASKFIIVTVRSERVASLNDTFDLDSAITSTPLVQTKVSSKDENVAADDVQINDAKRNLNQTFDHKQQLPIFTQNDFRSECQEDIDEKLGKTFNKERAKNENLVNTFNINNSTTVEDENIESLVENTNELPIQNALLQDSNEGEVNTDTQIIVDNESKTNILIQNITFDKQKPIESPMIDSGISLKGEFEPVIQSNMAESRTGTLERNIEVDNCEQAVSDDISSQIISKPLEDQEQAVQDDVNKDNFGGEKQLAADLLAGHEKKVRPLSLISSTSVDTGYVPDTDSEMGTLTVNSPTDWTDRQIVPTANTEVTQSSMTELPATVKTVCLESDSDLCSDAGTILATDTEMEDSDREVTAFEVIEWNMELEVPVLDADINDLCKNIDEPVSIAEADMVDIVKERKHQDLNRTPSDDTQETTPTNVYSPNEVALDDGLNNEDREDDISGIVALLQTEKGIMDEDICLVHQEDVVQWEETEPKDDNNSVDSTTLVEGVSEDVNSNNMQVKLDSAETKDSQKKEAADESEQHFVIKEMAAGTEDLSKKDTVRKEETKPKVKVSAGKVKKLSKKKMQVIKVDHKKPNISNVGSRIANYIKAPLPLKPVEDHSAMENGKNKKNLKKSNSDKRKSVENFCSDNNGKLIEIRTVEKIKVVKDIPKITIKKSTPKSKWGNIMMQIEASKDDHKPKPKAEVKSKLDINMRSTPPPNTVNKRGSDAKKIQSSPMPNYSKIKSKLNLACVKQDSSSASKKNEELKKKSLSRKSSVHSITHLDLSESQTSSQFGSTLSSARSTTGSRTDVSTDGNIESQPSSPASVTKVSNRTVNQVKSLTRYRHPSAGSTLSNVSQESVKVANTQNGEKTQQTNHHSITGTSLAPSTDSATIEARSRSSTESTCRANAKPATPSTSTRQSSAGGRGINKPTPAKTEANQNKNKTSKAKNNQKPGSQRYGGRSIHPTSAAEIARLEALCEARTKELTFSKLQLRSSQLAFDAMSVLVNYLSHDLDAFSCPELGIKLHTAQEQLEELQKQNEELRALNQKLDHDLQEQEGEQKESISKLVTEHDNMLVSTKKNLLQQHTEDFQKVERRQSLEITILKESHELQIKKKNSDHNQSMSNFQLSHQEEILSLRNKQELQMEELHRQHRDKLEDITQRFEGIKMGLSDKVESLRCECEELRTRAHMCEDALQRDSDNKVQIALAPFITLPREIESLKTVIEMRNEEIQKLRLRNVDVEKQLEELPKAQEKILSLQQKLENVEAIVSIKTDHEKQLHEKCQRLMRRFEKESKTNKRLSMDYEELMWRMSRSSEFGSQESLARRQLSRSPPDSESSSPDVSRKFRSPIDSDIENSPSRPPIPGVVYRKHASYSESSSNRKLKHRSAAFIVDGNRQSPSRSPVPRRLSPGADYSSSPPRNGDSGRMAHSLNDIEVFETPQGLPSPVEPPGLRSFSDSSDALIGVRIDQNSEDAADDGRLTAEGASTLSDISESLQDTSESFSHECGIDMSSQDETGSLGNNGSHSDHSDDSCSSPIREVVLSPATVDVNSDEIVGTAEGKGDNSPKCSYSVNDICDMENEVFKPLAVNDVADVNSSQTDVMNSQCQMSKGETILGSVVKTYSASQDQSIDHVLEESCDTVLSHDHDSLDWRANDSVMLDTNSHLQSYEIEPHVVEGESVSETCVCDSLALAVTADEMTGSENCCIEDNSLECVHYSTCDSENSHHLDRSDKSVDSCSVSSKLSSHTPIEMCFVSSDTEQDLAEDSRTKSTLETRPLVCSADDTSDSVATETSVEEMFTLDMDANDDSDVGNTKLSPHTEVFKSTEPSIEFVDGAPVLPVKRGFKESTV